MLRLKRPELVSKAAVLLWWQMKCVIWPAGLSKSTRQIQAVIEKMHQSSTLAVKVMNEGKQQAELSVQQARCAGDWLAIR